MNAYIFCPSCGNGIETGPTPSSCYVTPTEAKVLNLLIEGKSNREIGEKLGHAARTVKAHINHLTRKFGIAQGHKHPRILLAKYWSCSLFRIGVGYELPPNRRPVADVDDLAVDGSSQPGRPVAELHP